MSFCSFVTIGSACDEGFAGLEIGGRDGLEAQGREKEPLRKDSHAEGGDDVTNATRYSSTL